MSRALITETYLTGIANAIRTKLGVQNTYTPPQMASAIESIPTGITPTGTKNITQNGTHDVTQYASANVNVPNSYAAGDEGKVVSNGALVAQTSRNVTANGTYDTTTNDEVVVSVAPNLQSKTATQNGTITPDQGYDGLSSVVVNVSGGGGAVDRSKQNSSLGGNCYIKEGKITGFTTGPSIWQPRDANNTNLTVNWSQPFKIHARLKLDNTYNGSQALYGANAISVYFVLPTCEIRPTAFWFGFTTNGSSWTDEITIATIPVVANGEYEIDVVYDSTKVSVTVSDGTNTETAEITPSAPMYSNSNNKIGFGGIAQNGNLVARYVTFDPDDTYIESNGSIVWGAKTT